MIVRRLLLRNSGRFYRLESKISASEIGSETSILPGLDLRSDTVTLPSIEMREIMKSAICGDDVYQEDFTISELER